MTEEQRPYYEGKRMAYVEQRGELDAKIRWLDELLGVKPSGGADGKKAR
jgi:hypothetical protein